MNICVIPARGGSKRIPYKNIKSFHGRPMISWSIRQAISSNLFDQIVVSTDDPEIAEIALEEGAQVPFIRPPELADDNTATIPVIIHAIAELNLAQEDLVCCLYATAPFVRAAELEQGMQHLHTGAKFAVSVTRFNYPIQRALKRMDDGSVVMMNSDQLLTRSQDLEPAWHDAGQFYWGRASDWQLDATIFGTDTFGVELPSYRVVDIDTPQDWDRAELLFAALGLAE